MRFAKILVMALLAVSVVGVWTSANAQTGYVAVYFNQGMSLEQKDCPGASVIDTLYIGAVNWNMFLAGIQFKVNYPATFSTVIDEDNGWAHVGTTATGYATGFGVPQNGYLPVLVTRVIVIWNCNDCSSTNVPITVVGHPFLGGTVTATRWPDNVKIDGIGLEALICATVPTEETTWGKVKSLYGE
jgi:hypothetical protein